MKRKTLQELTKYRYTVKQHIVEAADFNYTEGTHTIYLSTRGTNDDEVSKELVEFLQFVRSGTNNGNMFVEQLSASIDRIKSDRELGANYMLLEEMMKDERKAGKAEGRKEDILKILTLKGFVADEAAQKIRLINDISVLNSLFEAAIASSSLEDFCKNID